MSQRSHLRCPVAGCQGLRRRNEVMCSDHWFQVPYPQRERVWATSDQPGSREHMLAIRDALAAVRPNREVEN